MKVRNGFVSNSSSSSFFILAPKAAVADAGLDTREAYFLKHSYRVNHTTFHGEACIVIFGTFGSDYGSSIDWKEIGERYVAEDDIVAHIGRKLKAADDAVLYYCEDN